MNLSIVIPSLNRPILLHNTVCRLLETAPGAEIIVVSESPEGAVEFLPQIVYLQEGGTGIEKGNLGAKVARGDWLLGASDDLLWSSEWYQIALATPNKGFIGLQDGEIPPADFSPHIMASREWLRTYNGGVLGVPHYKSWYVDIEACEKAKLSGTYAYTPKQVVTHLRNFVADDSTHAKGRQFHEADHRTFLKRQSENYPNDFEGYL